MLFIHYGWIIYYDFPKHLVLYSSIEMGIWSFWSQKSLSDIYWNVILLRNNNNDEKIRPLNEEEEGQDENYHLNHNRELVCKLGES